MAHQPWPVNPREFMRQMQSQYDRMNTDVQRLLRRAGDAFDQKRYDTAPEGGGSGSGTPGWAKVTLASGQKLYRSVSATGAGYKYNTLTNEFDISLGTVTVTGWDAMTGFWTATDVVLCVLRGSGWYGTGSGRHEFRGTNGSGGTITKGSTASLTIANSISHTCRAFDKDIADTKAVLGWWNETTAQFDISGEC